MKWFIVLLLPMGVWGSEIPTGPQSWFDSTTMTRRWQAGGESSNYDSAGTWRAIEPSWVATDSGWQVTKGAYRTTVDSQGTIRYTVKGHTLGMRPLKLVWFKPADSTWVDISTFSANNFILQDDRLGAINPFGIGVHVEYHYRPDAFSQRFRFSANARNNLKTSYQAQGDNTLWLGTVTRLDVSQINMSLRRLGQIFNGGDIGERTKLELRGDSVTIVNNPVVFLGQRPSDTGMPYRQAVKRRFVKKGDFWYLVELVNPRKMAQAPAGELWHSADWSAGQTAAAMKATTLRSGSTNANYGAWNGIRLDNQGGSNDDFALFQPATDGSTGGYTQDSCYLHIYYANWWDPLTTDSVEIEGRILKRTWGEGDNTSGAADAGECSWDSSVTGTTAWSTAGATHTDDRENDIAAMDTIPYAPSNGDEFILPIIGDTDVRGAIDYGVHVEVTTITGYVSGIGITSDDDGTAGTRPYMEFWESAAGGAVEAVLEVHSATGARVVHGPGTPGAQGGP